MSECGGHYLLTWTTYGTWLPGDPRGFVAPVIRPDGSTTVRNTPGTPYDKGNDHLHTNARAQMKHPEVVLDHRRAIVVQDALYEVCSTHNLLLHIGAIMRTHIHIVVKSNRKEGVELLRLFKGVSSRRLGQAFGKQVARWWTIRGSHRLLISPASLEGAVNYVRAHKDALEILEYASEATPD